MIKRETSLLFITGWEKNLEKAKKSEFDNLNPAHYLISEGRVKKAHEKGLGVYAWTVDDKREARKLRDIGVDGIISNCIKYLD